MKEIITVLLFVFVCAPGKSMAQTIKQADTLYVVGDQNNLEGKFYSISGNKSKIDFFYKVLWKLHESEHHSVVFRFEFPESRDNFWSIPIKSIKDILINKMLTLAQFTEALSNEEFLRSLPQKQLILLSGVRGSEKFEVYPVKLGTDLSSEG